MDKISPVLRWSGGLSKTAAVRPPSIPGLNRRSGRIPALPYSPIKQFDCTADAVSSKAKSICESHSPTASPYCSFCSTLYSGSHGEGSGVELVGACLARRGRYYRGGPGLATARSDTFRIDRFIRGLCSDRRHTELYRCVSRRTESRALVAIAR